MKQRIFVLVLMGVLLIGCQCGELDQKVFTGWHKSNIGQVLGEPDRVENLVKNAEHIFGSVGNLWYQMEMGDKIVIWVYQTKTGHKELYFLNDSPEVAGEFFWYKDSSLNPVF